jgi:hypothetical protein
MRHFDIVDASIEDLNADQVKLGLRVKALESAQLTVQVEKSSDTSVFERVTRMLRLAPRNANSTCVNLWSQLQPLNVEWLHEYWAMVDQDSPMMDLENCHYDEWEEQGKIRLGMRHRITGKRHGIVRTIDPNGTVVEATYKNGRMHGVYRWICDEEIRMQVSQDGQGKAVLHINHEFKELVRNDPFELFSKIQPENLKCNGD